MAVFGYDESCQERWTISDDEASRRFPRQPERLSFGHLARLANGVLNAESRRLTARWTSAELAGIDVVVLPDPALPHPIDRAGIDALVNFVRNGGGLFLIVSHRNSGPESAASVIAAAFGVRVTGDEVVSSRHGHDHLLSAVTTCAGIQARGPASGVRHIVCHGGVSLECAREPLTAITAPAGHMVFAAVSHGLGRVAVIGSGELFSIPYVGQADNALLYIGTLAWLAGEDPREDESERRRETIRELLGENHYSPRLPPRGMGAGDEKAIPTIDVSAAKRKLLRLYRRGLSPYADIGGFLRHAESSYHELPTDIRHAIADFRNNSNDSGALLVTGLPSDPALPPTPGDPAAAPFRDTYFSEFWLTVVSCGLGDQVGYMQEGGGTFFRNVLPTSENATLLSSESSAAPLDFHTEIAFHPAMPDYLLLYCLRPAPRNDARTLVAGARNMIALVPLGFRPVLFRRAFRTGVDYSFGSQNGQAGNGPLTSVLYGDPFDPLLCLDPDLMVGEDEEASAALAAIKATMASCAAEVSLGTSDLLVIDNRRAVHGRSRFTACYDGQDRWLQRSYAVRDINRYSEELVGDGRVFGTAFAV
ncbi:hypothetical protein [Streptosporangium sp. NPDC002524]|uniref:hypothetical protein n=1 Tax=Streptosporangium sp. NPDC002524 TaxID=3154537 RepID=UPI00332B661F